MIARLALVLAIYAMLSGAVFAQMSGGMMFPGPGTVHATGGGGCTMNGTLDFSGTHTCNMIYYATGVIQ